MKLSFFHVYYKWFISFESNEVFIVKYSMKIKIGKNEMDFGKGVVLLMEKSEQYGSLSAAYKEMGMSSSKAWKIIRRAQEDLGFCLFETKSGGCHGGSTTLTPQGKKILKQYTQFTESVLSFANQQFKLYFKEEEK